MCICHALPAWLCACRAKQLEGHQPSLNEIKQARTSVSQVAAEQ
jgi:hypothetical protein